MSNDTTIEQSIEAPPKEKLRTIMDAASALTSLGDEEGGNDAPEVKKEPSHEAGELPPTVGSTDASSLNPVKHGDEPRPSSPKSLASEASIPQKRYLPEHKKPDAAPTFPEKMMNLMRYADQFKDDKDYCIAWLPEGKSFVIRNPDDFSRNVVPQFFKPTKFSSFTRKLYRWGFRQINRGIGPDDPIIFGNEYFDRENAELMAKMRSITAAGARKAEQQSSGAHAMMSPGVGKRSFFESGGIYEQGGPDQKRLFDHYLNQKANLMNQGMPFYGAAMGSNGGPMSIGNIPMRPSMGGGGHNMGGGGHMGGAPGLGLDGSGHGAHAAHPQQYLAQPQMMGGYPGLAQAPHKPYEMMHQQQQSQMPHMQGLSHGMGTMSPGGYNAGMQHMHMQQQMQQHYQMQMQMHQQMQASAHNNDSRNTPTGSSGGGNNGVRGMMEQELLQQGMSHQSPHMANGGGASGGGSNCSMGGMNNSGSSNHNNMATPPTSNQGGGANGSYPNPQSTAEIVNAAIAALRYAN